MKGFNMKLKWRRFIGKYAQIIWPYYSTCKRCQRPWKICEGHSTWYLFQVIEGASFPYMGMFPLCEDCWPELTPAERLPYYHDLHYSHRPSTSFQEHDEEWRVIEQQVLAGK